MDWSRGYTASYYVSIVDPATWRDLETIEITGGSINRDYEDGLRESASFDCDNYSPGIEQWIRIYLYTQQEGSNDDHVALFTGLATSPSVEYSGVLESRSIECYSVLKPANDIYLLRGWYAPRGMTGGEVIRDLLSVIPAPVIIEEGSPILSNNIIADDEETRLSMVHKVLMAMSGWRMRIGGDGTVYIEKIPDQPSDFFDPLYNPVIETDIKITEDLFSCPNIFIALEDEITAIARDDSDGNLSVTNRGREVMVQESGCQLMDNETIEEYANRRLRELQQHNVSASYNRRFIPDIYPGDPVRLSYPEQGLDNIFYVESQSIELSYAARTSETVIARG